MPPACCRRYRYRSVRALFELVLVCWCGWWCVVVYVCVYVCLLLFAGHRWGVRSACVGEVEFVGDIQACV
jgi:hypothetical protein